MSWTFPVLGIALFILVAAFYMLYQQRRPSLDQIVRELSLMGLGESPRYILGRMLRSCAEILGARRLVLFYYDADSEQLYRWDHRQGAAEPVVSEVPPRDLEAWIVLDRIGGAEDLAADHPLSRRLEAGRITSVRFSWGAHCGRLLVVDPTAVGPDTMRHLQALCSHLALLLEQFLRLRRVRANSIDEERSRIARDFHDGPLQTFLSLDMQMEFIRKLLDLDPQRAGEELRQLQLLTRRQGKEIRDLLREMRPIDLEGATLLGLLRNLVQDFQKDGDLCIQLLADSHRVDAPQRICREVFQIVREALNNARKHAQPRNIIIALDAQADELTLKIDDDGKGFHFAGRYTLEELDRMRIGPVSIKERAHALGAALELESNPGLGARLLLRVPLTPRKQ